MIAVALLLDRFVLSFIAGCRDAVPAGYVQLNMHPAVIYWLAHTEDSPDLANY